MTIEKLSSDAEPNPTSAWDEEYPETTAGPANDETALVPPVTVAAHELAWSVDTEVIESQPWAPVLGQAAVMVAIGSAVAVVIGILGWMVFHQDSPAPVSVPPTMPAAALPPISTEPTPTGPMDIHDLGPEAVPPTPVPTSTVPAPPTSTSSFSGRYTMTNINEGHKFTETWSVTPCGDGCVRIGEDGSPPFARALLVGGFWRWDSTSVKAVCDDGSEVDNAGTSHTDIDATLLRGTAYFTWRKACPGDSPGTNTNNIVLTRVVPPAPTQAPDVVAPPTTVTVTPPPPPAVTVQAAPPAPSRDDEFIERLQADQLVLHNRTEALNGAHWVCRQLAAGHSQADIVASAERDNPTVTHLGMVDYVSTAAAFYCPEFSGS